MGGRADVPNVPPASAPEGVALATVSAAGAPSDPAEADTAPSSGICRHRLEPAWLKGLGVMAGVMDGEVGGNPKSRHHL